MQQYEDVKPQQNFKSSRDSQANYQNIKDVIAIVHQKKKHYKKEISQIHSSLQHQSNFKYLFNSSNSINAVTPQQKQILKEEHLARGSIPELQQNNNQYQKFKKHRLKFDKLKNHKSLKNKPMKRVGQSRQIKRYRTQSHEESTFELKRSILCTLPKQLPSISRNEQSRNKLRVFIAQIKRNGNYTDKLERIYSILNSFNPFFTKIEKTIGVCLLRVGELYQLNINKTLYDLGAPQCHIFIILEGQIRLKGHQGMRKICSTGETLLEEALFLQNFNGALQKAVAINDTLILEIKMRSYDKLIQELYKFGYKQEVQELNSVIRRNFILKNWLRTKFKHIYNN